MDTLNSKVCMNTPEEYGLYVYSEEYGCMDTPEEYCQVFQEY